MRIFKATVQNNSIKLPKDVMEHLGISNSSEVLIFVSEGKIVIYPISKSNVNIDDHISWLRDNAPKCFVADEKLYEDKWVSVEWMKRKLGLKEELVHNQ